MSGYLWRDKSLCRRTQFGHWWNAAQLSTTRPRDTEYRAKICKDSDEGRAEGKGDFIQELLCEDRRANPTDSENAVVAVMRISDNGSGAGTAWNGACDRSEGDLKLSLQWDRMFLSWWRTTIHMVTVRSEMPTDLTEVCRYFLFTLQENQKGGRYSLWIPTKLRLYRHTSGHFDHLPKNTAPHHPKVRWCLCAYKTLN